ncbi:hypothetical protein DMN91_008971 [Ooceraea biroi]|uniref:Uncharacterized protein n=1 Tax=Ooceraea biroi TaxID=2015173 RepID=A0A3L8DDY8_OOCBI|nr:hypothetical protein DMN91_008971 [Ooceraea biroi]
MIGTIRLPTFFRTYIIHTADSRCVSASRNTLSDFFPPVSSVHFNAPTRYIKSEKVWFISFKTRLKEQCRLRQRREASRFLCFIETKVSRRFRGVFETKRLLLGAGSDEEHTAGEISGTWWRKSSLSRVVSPRSGGRRRRKEAQRWLEAREGKKIGNPP